MPKTEADKWFEAYLLEHGYTPGSHEPDLSELGVRSRPDYLPMRPSGERIACEVKSFGINRLTERLGRQRTIVASSQEEYGPVRGQVKAAARTLKPLHPHGFPLVVVLTKTDPAVLVDLTVDAVAAALYGNPGYVLEIDRRTGAAVDEGRYELGRDGKLTTDHPYLGAVALLRRRPHEADERAELHEEVRRTAPDYDALSNRERATLHLQALEGRIFAEGCYLWLDVIEARSETATPLPDNWFDGPRDSRWRWIAGEHGEHLMRVRGTGDY